MKECLSQIPTPNPELVIRVRENAIDKTKGFYQRFGIHEFIGRNPFDKALFVIYFARYLILKNSYETNWLLNHPTAGTLANVPILGGMIRFLDKQNLAAESASALLEENAKKLAEIIYEQKRTEELQPNDIQAAANFMSTAYLEKKYKKSQDLTNAIEEIKARYKRAH